MICYKCAHQCRTIYPTYASKRFVQSICPNCDWVSRPIEIPDTRRDMDEC